MLRKKVFGNREIAYYLFLLPGLCFFAFAIAIPFLMGINIAFTDWDGLSKTCNYNGIQNFIDIFKDLRIVQPVKNTFLFALLGVVGNTVISLGLALLVKRKFKFVTTISRTAFFVPVCFSAILTAYIWGFIFRVIIPGVMSVKNPLGNTKLVIICIVAMNLWNTCGINMLIYLSGLKNIPEDLYEAAVIDGSNRLQNFRYITLPLLAPTFTICITSTLTGFMKEFAMTLASTSGGPAGASRTISIYIYENLYRYGKAGYGQAISILFIVVIAILSYILEAFFRRREIDF